MPCEWCKGHGLCLETLQTEALGGTEFVDSVGLDRQCQQCEGTGTVVEKRDARLDELDDVQFRFLLEATRVKNGTDDKSQSQRELQQKSGMSPAGSVPSMPSGSF